MRDYADNYECLGIIYYLAFNTDFASVPVLKSVKHRRTVYPMIPQREATMLSEKETL